MTIEAEISATETNATETKKVSVSLIISEKPAPPVFPQNVVINEIGWMGTKSSAQDEWIELYNNSGQGINLEGWILSWEQGTTTRSIDLNKTISPYGFYLLERTDDNPISDIEADTAYTGGLINDGEKLELRDTSGTLIDMVDCSKRWFAGKASPDYISMERISPDNSGSNPENWAPNNTYIRNGWDAGDENGENKEPILGTPKYKNSASFLPIPALDETPWPIFRHDNQRTGHSPYTGPKWTTSSQATITQEIDFPSISLIIGSDKTIYGGGNKVFALNSVSGQEKWSFRDPQFSDFSYSHLAIAADKTLYFIGGKPYQYYLYALDSENQKLKWKYFIRTIHISPLAIDDQGIIYFTSKDPDNLYAINPNGSLKWQRSFNNEHCFAPTLDPMGNIWVSDWGSVSLIGFNREGKVIYGQPHSSYATGFASPPIIDPSSNTLYFGQGSLFYYYHLSVLDLDTISPIWSKRYNSFGDHISSFPALSSNNKIYIAGGHTAGWSLPDMTSYFGVYALDSQKAEKILSLEKANSNHYISAKIITDKNGVVYISTSLKTHPNWNNLFAIDQNGEIKWSLSFDSAISSPIIAGNGVLYIISDGKLYILK